MSQNTGLFKTVKSIRMGCLLMVLYGGLGSAGVQGRSLEVYNTGTNPAVAFWTVRLDHYLNAKEGYCAYDFPLTLPPSTYNLLQIYSFVPSASNPQKLQLDSRPAESLTTYQLELAHDGFSGVTDNYLIFVMRNPANYAWKNIFLCGEANAETVVADIKTMIYTSGLLRDGKPCGEFPLGTLEGTHTGVYDRRKIKFFHYADLNRDGVVNMADMCILASEFTGSGERFGINTGYDVNDLGSYADINRDGVVDMKDFAILAYHWLHSK